MAKLTRTEADAARRLHRKGAEGLLREARLLRLEADGMSGERRATALRQARLCLREAALVQESDKARLAFVRSHPNAARRLGLPQKAMLTR